MTSSGLQIGALHGASQSTTNFHTSLGHSQPLSRPGSAHGSLSHYLNGAQDPYLSKAAPYTDPMGRFNVSDPALLGLTSRNNGYVDAMVSSAGEPSSASSSPSSTDLYAQAQQYPLLSSSEPHPLETSPHSHPHYIAHPQSETLRPWTSSSTNARYSQTPYYLDQDFPPINISAPPARSIPPSTSSVTTDSYTAGLFPAMASLSSSLPNNSNHSSQNSSSPSSSIDKSLPPPPPPKSDTYQSTPAYRSVFDPVAPSRPSSNSYALSGILTNGYATYPNGLDALGVAAAQGVHQQQDQTQQHAHQNGTSDKKEFEDTPRKLTTPAGGLDGHPVQ